MRKFFTDWIKLVALAIWVLIVFAFFFGLAEGIKDLCFAKEVARYEGE